MNDHKYTDSEVLVVAGGTSGKQQVNGTYADLRGASGEWYNTKLGEVRKAGKGNMRHKGGDTQRSHTPDL